MTYSPYGEIDELDDEEQKRLNAEQDNLNAIQDYSDEKAKTDLAVEQEQAAEATATTQQPTNSPKPAPAKEAKPQKQVPGWGADPKPEDRWNIRDRAHAKS